MFKNEKTLQINGEFPSLTITIFPSFKIKKLMRLYNAH